MTALRPGRTLPGGAPLVKYRPWAVAVRLLAVPVWYPFALLAWIGEKADAAFWRIERALPDARVRKQIPKRRAVSP